MALREGDSITVRRSAVIWLTQYDALKPQCLLRRTIGEGEDPEVVREEMDRILYVELRRAVLCELQDRTEMRDALEVSTTRLIKHCEKVIADGPQGRSTKQEDFPQRKEGSGRKKVARKARRSRS